MFFGTKLFHKIDVKLKKTNSFVRNPIFKGFKGGVSEVEVVIDKIVETKVANMKDELWQILDMMGNECKKYYD